MLSLIKRGFCIHNWKRGHNIIWDTYSYTCTKCGKSKQASRTQMEKKK